MRRLNLVLLASLQLCRARQPGFSIHDDVLAHPQFDVVFSNDFISETDALALLESSRARNPTDTADYLSQTDLTGSLRKSGTGSSDGHGSEADDEDAPVSESYELINSAPWRYLCSVPVVSPPPALNRTATELAKAEEARELSRASAKGWELMSGLDGQCMYFMSGWWSYSFCYGKAVVQFHALPSSKNGPPTRDEHSQEYVLGRVQEPSSSDSRSDGQTKSLPPPNGQLQVKGDQRYLSQRLEGGTICDLTGRPRTIEVQYHCSPGSTTDRIGWIKEVTTCTYLMVVYTPRLCADVAFQPPKETRAHPIRCRQVVSTAEEESAWRYHKRVEAGELFSSKGKARAGSTSNANANNHDNKNHQQHQFTGMTIGGVVVGGKKVLGGSAAHKLAPPRHLAAAAARAQTASVEIVLASKKDGAAIEALTDEELQKLNLDPKKVKEYRDEMEKRAAGRGWKLQVVDVPGAGLEYVGAIDEEEAGNDHNGQKGQAGGADGNSGKPGKQALTKGKKEKGSEKEGGKKPAAKQEADDQEEGSQEIFFKEEL